MQSLRLFVISLQSAQPRRERMVKLMSDLGVPFDFFDAVNGREMSPDLPAQMNFFPRPGLTMPEMACTMSHICLWQKMVDEGIDQVLIMEDDVHCAPALRELAQAFAPPADEVAIYRFETMLASVVAHRQPALSLNGIGFHQILTNHAGTAAYALNRATAAWLLTQVAHMREPIDAELFNPEGRHIAPIKVLQAIPGVCIQDDVLPPDLRTASLVSGIGRRSADIEGTKRADSSLVAWARNALRPLYLWLASQRLKKAGLMRIRVEYAGMSRV